MKDIDEILQEAEELISKRNWQELIELLKQADISTFDNLHKIGVFLLPRLPLLSSQYLEALVKQYPNSDIACINLGILKWNLGKYNESEELFNNAIKINPLNTLPRKLLTLHFVRKKKYQNALDNLTELGKHLPDDNEIKLNLAKLYEFLSMDMKAKELYTELLKTNPEELNARSSMRRYELLGSFDVKTGHNKNTIVMLVFDSRIDRRVLDEAATLKKAGYDVTVVGGVYPKTNPFDDEENYPEIDIVRADSRRFMAFDCKFESKHKYFLRTRLNKDAINQFEIESKLSLLLKNKSLHNHFYSKFSFYLEAIEHPASIYTGHDLIMLPAALMAAGKYNSYVVYDSHELYPEQFYEQSTRAEYTEFDLTLSQLADKVITVNKSIADEMKDRYHIDAEVILNCPSGLNVVSNNWNKNYFKNKYSLPENSKVLLYQGGIVARHRNLENLIRGMRHVKTENLYLVMMGPDFGEKKLLEDIAVNEGVLNTKLFFHDSVSQNELLQYTAAADAGIIPYTAVSLNNYYCTPNKLFEFITAGLPIIATNLPELNRFISQKGVGINSKMESEFDIADAIDCFFSSDINCFKENIELIKHEFEWGSQEDTLKRIYEEVKLLEPKSKDINTFLDIVYSYEKGDYVSCYEKSGSIKNSNLGELNIFKLIAEIEYKKGERNEALKNIIKSLTYASHSLEAVLSASEILENSI